MTQGQDEETDVPVPASGKGYEHPEDTKRDEPLKGERTERQPAWRPGGRPAGQGVYSGGGEQATSTGTEDEPEGPGI
jgi:hypothetical protein